MKYRRIIFLMLFAISNALFAQVKPIDTDGNGYLTRNIHETFHITFA